MLCFHLLTELTWWAQSPPHPHSFCRRAPTCPGWPPSRHQTVALCAPDDRHTPALLSANPAAAEVEVARAVAETPCKTSSCGAAARRLPGGPGGGREQGRGGGRRRAETPRRELGGESGWEEENRGGRKGEGGGGGGEKEKRGGRRHSQPLIEKGKWGSQSPHCHPPRSLTPNSPSLILPPTKNLFPSLFCSFSVLFSSLFPLLLSPPLPPSLPQWGRCLSVMLLLFSRHFYSPSLWSSRSGGGDEAFGGCGVCCKDLMEWERGGEKNRKRGREGGGWRDLEVNRERERNCVKGLWQHPPTHTHIVYLHMSERLYWHIQWVRCTYWRHRITVFVYFLTFFCL